MKERHMQSRESKVVSSKALDASLVVTECNGTKSNEHITSNSSGTYITHVVDVDIRPSGLVPNPPPAAPYVPPTNKELEILFQPMFDEYFETSMVDHLVPPAPTAQAPVNPTGPSVSIPIDQEAPSGSHSPSSSDHQSSSVHQGVVAEHSFEVNPFVQLILETFFNVFAPYHNYEASSSRVIATKSNQTTQPHEHIQNGPPPTLLIILLGTLLDRYPLGSSLLQMLCGASTIQYYPKSNRKTSNLLLLKTAGFKPCKMKSMNLIDWTYGN
ncbi:hypothetical protein Tco_0978582 [Tanacetum coccineum]|uniref:Uncharacterized protein n=1 Tax=Tanacetum coccineum TaxID=301880 RepID=A0ABQ5ENG7_9ASTR